MNKHFALIPLLCLLSAAALAGDAKPSRYYGRLDMTGFATAKTVNAKPLLADAAADAAAAPIYLHLRPGQHKQWSRFCAEYEACAVPVFVVEENWFVNVYLATVGMNDGRAQRYVELQQRVRDEREHHHGYDEDEE